MDNPRKILVTSALPYANGDLHLGHLVEHIQTDIWARAQNLNGNHCLAICGDDAHGTPIMIKAQNLGIEPEAMVADMKQRHEQDFEAFHVHYDNYHTTHSPENKALAEKIYKRLNELGYIKKKTISQAFDPVKEMFLPDRYVKGECPSCGRADQYGDNCEACGATYNPTDLINPVSTLSGATPIEKDSEHYFFNLPAFEQLLKDWTQQGHLQSEVSNKLNEWFEDGLKMWDISRDAPYFGFEIPDAPGKYFYVWLDAPIGYMASFLNYCNQHPEVSFDEYWGSDSNAELYHFVGKDIIYFHALFWPAMLSGSQLRLPTAIFTHGFLTIDGQKMSKSRGTFITASEYLEHLDAEYLRYYFAAKLSPRIDDIDLSFEDFMARVNSDLVGKVVNIASRCSGFITKNFDGLLSKHNTEPGLLLEFIDNGSLIAKLYEDRDYAKAVREIMRLADVANQYIDKHKPWLMIKDSQQKEAVQQVCSVGINMFRLLMIYLKPILPKTAYNVEQFLNIEPMSWQHREQLLHGHKINKFKPLMKRIEMKDIESLRSQKAQQKNSHNMNDASNNSQKSELDLELKPEISYEQFSQVDLRVARIISAEAVEGADKLLKLIVDIGGTHKQVFAGIKAAYSAESLVGKLTVVVANLKPRKMRFGNSEGMVLACGPGGQDLWILHPDDGAQPGMIIK